MGGGDNLSVSGLPYVMSSDSSRFSVQLCQRLHHSTVYSIPTVCAALKTFVHVEEAIRCSIYFIKLPDHPVSVIFLAL